MQCQDKQTRLCRSQIAQDAAFASINAILELISRRKAIDTGKKEASTLPIARR